MHLALVDGKAKEHLSICPDDPEEDSSRFLSPRARYPPPNNAQRGDHWNRDQQSQYAGDLNPRKNTEDLGERLDPVSSP
jgi:hypothetical protein